MAISEMTEKEYQTQELSSELFAQSDKQDVQDNIIKSMQFVIDSELQKLKKDVTYEAVVIDTDEADIANGIYRVQIGSIKTKAYAQNSMHYKENDTVYVMIPQNDYNQQKFILGLRVEEEDVNQLYTYSFPFDNFIQLKELINMPSTLGYRANQSEAELLKEEIIDSQTGQPTGQYRYIDAQWPIASYTGDEQVKIIGTKLGISVDIQSLLMDYRPISGNYGLKIVVHGLAMAESAEITAPYTRVFYFDISHMYGNPYVYPTYTNQQAIFEIPETFSISNIDISFWQDIDNDPFINEDGQQIPWRIAALDNRPCDYNILIKNLKVYVGKLAEEMEGSEVFLYTYNDLLYGQQTDVPMDRSAYDHKTCMMAFVYKDENGKYHLYDTLDELNAAGATVYWYIKNEEWLVDSSNPVYLDSNNNTHIQPYDTYLGNNLWAPIGENPPSPIAKYNSTRYNNQSMSFTCDLTKDDYRIRCVVSINGQQYLSNVLIFSNVLTPEADAQTLAMNNKVILRVGMLLSTMDGTTQVLYPDETLQHFYVYDENNRVLKTDDKREINYKYDGQDLVLHGLDNVSHSDIEYFVEIWIRDDNYASHAGQRELGSYVRLADWAAGEQVINNGYDDTNYRYTPFYVTWHLPSSDNSMMDCYEIPEEYKNLSTYYSHRDHTHVTWTGVHPETILTKFDVDRLTTRVFKIKSMYNFQDSDNTISVTLKHAGQVYTVKREFYFGKAMMQGSPYTPMINIALPEGNSYIVANQKFQLECRIIDLWGKEYLGDYTCKWSYLTRSEDLTSIGTLPLQSTDNIYDSYDIAYGHDAILSARAPANCDPIVVVVEVSLKNDPNLPEEYTYLINEKLYARRGLCITNDAKYLTCHKLTIPDRIQFYSDGQSPHYYTGNFICKYTGISSDGEVEIPAELNTEYFEYPYWHLDVEDTYLSNLLYLKCSPKYESLRYTVLSSDTYNDNLNYMYLDYDKLDYVVYDKNDDDLGHSNWLDLVHKGRMIYTKTVNYGAVHNSTSSNGALVMPTAESAPDVNEYRLVFQPDGIDALDTEATNNTSWVWRNEYLTDPLYVVSLRFTGQWKLRDYVFNDNIGDYEVQETIRNVTFVQPIAFDRSLYPSSLINKWNGTSLTLDYENGAILSTMIAAGTKNASTGAFTGVMMGNWAKKGDETFDSLDKRENASGIYGFLEGASSFAFRDDGTGYIGPAGAGRIQFDGRNALISNGDKSCYINLNPNTLTQQGEGWYNADNRGISPYFLYCKVPIDANTLLSYDAERDATWADQFMEDNNNNYFIVDPAHGALMSGGIVSKYGRIGNWYINSTGLYQKYTSDETKSYLEAKVALEVAKQYLKATLSLEENLSDKEKAYVLNNTHLNTLEEVTSDELDLALQSIRTTLSTKDYTKNRFMYLGMPGLDETTIFNTWKEYQNKIDLNEQQRKRALGESLDVEQPQNVTDLFLQLYPYLDKATFSVDVFHYFNTYLAVKYNVDYIKQILKQQNIIDENGSEVIRGELRTVQSELRANGATFDSDGNITNDFLSMVNQRMSEAEAQYQSEMITENQYQMIAAECSELIGLHNDYSMLLSNFRSATDAFRIALYDKNNIADYLLTYQHVNQHCHNHYSASGQPSGALYGLFSNITNVLGLSLASSLQSVVYYNAYNKLEITEEGQYYELSNIYQHPGDYYYTINDIGETRVFSYDPRIWSNRTEVINGITINNSSSGLYFQVMTAYDGMPTDKYSKPKKYKTDPDSTILNKVWSNSATNSSYNVNRSKFTSTYINLNYILDELLPQLDAYCYYYETYYNQCLFYMLQRGLEKTHISNPSQWAQAMTIINAIGGLDVIQATGLTQLDTIEVSIVGEGLSEDVKARLQIEYKKNINHIYDALLEDLKYERSLAINKLYAESDTNRYAIYAGYNSPIDWRDVDGQAYLDPLFGVKWNGYLLARHGKLGYNSPWYIGDAGLTQKNSSGIIFLGDPRVTGRPYTADDMKSFKTGNATLFETDSGEPIVTDSNGEPVNFLLPNDDSIVFQGHRYKVRMPNIIYDYNGQPQNEQIQLELDYQDNSYSDPDTGEWIEDYQITGNAIYDRYQGTITLLDQNYEEMTLSAASSNALLTYVGPEAFGEYGGYAIYAGDNYGINTGIRLDGTLFSRRAQFENAIIKSSDISRSTSHNNTQYDVEIYNMPLYDPETGDLESFGYHVDPTTGHTTYETAEGKSVYFGANSTLTYTDDGGILHTLTRDPLNGDQYTDDEGRVYRLTSRGYEYSEPAYDEYGNVIPGKYNTYIISADGTTYTDGAGNRYELTGSKQTFVAADGNTYEFSGTGLYYQNKVDGTFTYVDKTGVHLALPGAGEDGDTILYELRYGISRDVAYVDDAQLANIISRNNLILMGGNVSGWKSSDLLMVNYKEHPTITWTNPENGNVSRKLVESIALDAGNNQIRLANSQIVIDGTNGVLFIGRPYFNVDMIDFNSGPIAMTSAQMFMGAVAIQAITNGVTTYATGMDELTSTIYLNTYYGIQFGSASYEVTGQFGTGEIEETEPGYEELVAYAGDDPNNYLIPIAQTPQRNVIVYPINVNQYTIALDENETYITTTADLPSYDSHGIKLEFIDDPGENAKEQYGYVYGACIFRPLNEVSILGTDQHQWLIYARDIFLRYPDGDGNEVRTRVASRQYVDSNDKVLLDDIISVNNKAAEALLAASKAMSRANGALAEARKAQNQTVAILTGNGVILDGTYTWYDENGDPVEETVHNGQEFDISPFIHPGNGTGNITVGCATGAVWGYVNVSVNGKTCSSRISGSVSNFKSEVEKIAKSVFETEWAGLTASVSGSDTSCTVTISSESGEKIVGLSIDVDVTVEPCDLHYGVNEGGESAWCTHNQGSTSYDITWHKTQG